MERHVLTLTLNPAVDVSTAIDRVEPTHKLRCDAARTHAGGGGINVARVLQRLECPVIAVFTAGGLTGQRLQQMLAHEALAQVCIPIAGETRQSFSVWERTSGQDFRFVLPGPTLTGEEWTACLQAIAEIRPGPQYLVASGSLPPGVPPDFYARVARITRQRGGRLVLDSSGPALAAALEAGVFLVKPSLRELQDLTGLPLHSPEQWRDAARAVIARGHAEIVALSLGERGAMLVTSDQVLYAPALDVPVASTIGAGDSFVAGMVQALSRGAPLDEVLAWGMAAGAGALLTPGTALCRRADVEALLGQVRIERS